MRIVDLGLRGIALVGLLSACGSTVTPVVDPTEDLGAIEDSGATVDVPGLDAGTAPTDRGTAPTDNGSAPTDRGTAPTDNGSAPTDNGAAPTDNGAAPTDNGAAPLDSGAAAACRSNAECSRGSFCSAATCDGPGRCEARPTGCATVYLPVCGCDGRTYGNTCEAAAAGARVLDRGVCGADAGVVRDVPTVDTGLSVCATIRCSAGNACCDVAGAPSYGGCYPTTCLGCCVSGGSRDAGVADAAVTDVPPGACASNADCPLRTQYCAGAGCGTAGTCQTRPRICSTLYSPVCGCDGMTYSNSCNAESAGVRVASRGACVSVPDAGLSPCALVRCSAGFACCDSPRSPSYGRCYDTRCLACCM